MKEFIKKNSKYILIVMICVFGSYITSLATNYAFESTDVRFDNTGTEITAGDVQGALEQTFQHVTDYNEIKDTIGSGSLTTTSQTLIGAVNGLNDQIETITVSSSTTIKSLVANGTKRYTATTSSVFTDFPGTNTRYYPIISIYKSRNNAQIDISCVSGNNEPIFIRGYYENNTLYWYNINDQIVTLNSKLLFVDIEQDISVTIASHDVGLLVNRTIAGITSGTIKAISDVYCPGVAGYVVPAIGDNGTNLIIRGYNIDTTSVTVTKVKYRVWYQN